MDVRKEHLVVAEEDSANRVLKAYAAEASVAAKN